MKRIAIMGCSGSGKSTLARALGERLDLPVHHLDSYFWQPGWKESDYKDFAPKVQAILDGESWIVDGGYIKSDPEERRFREVDVLILFDRPVWLCLWRVIKRAWKYRNSTRPDMGEGCIDKVDWEFVSYIWNYRKTGWPHILERVQRHKTPTIIVQADPDIETLVAELNHLAAART